MSALERKRSAGEINDKTAIGLRVDVSQYRETRRDATRLGSDKPETGVSESVEQRRRVTSERRRTESMPKKASKKLASGRFFNTDLLCFGQVLLESGVGE